MAIREASVLCLICGETAIAKIGAETPEFRHSAVRWAAHFALAHPGMPVDANTVIADGEEVA